MIFGIYVLLIVGYMMLWFHHRAIQRRQAEVARNIRTSIDTARLIVQSLEEEAGNGKKV